MPRGGIKGNKGNKRGRGVQGNKGNKGGHGAQNSAAAANDEVELMSVCVWCGCIFVWICVCW